MNEGVAGRQFLSAAKRGKCSVKLAAGQPNIPQVVPDFRVIRKPERKARVDILGFPCSAKFLKRVCMLAQNVVVIAAARAGLSRLLERPERNQSVDQEKPGRLVARIERKRSPQVICSDGKIACMAAGATQRQQQCRIIGFARQRHLSDGSGTIIVSAPQPLRRFFNPIPHR